MPTTGFCPLVHTHTRTETIEFCPFLRHDGLPPPPELANSQPLVATGLLIARGRWSVGTETHSNRRVETSWLNREREWCDLWCVPASPEGIHTNVTCTWKRLCYTGSHAGRGICSLKEWLCLVSTCFAGTGCFAASWLADLFVGSSDLGAAVHWTLFLWYVFFFLLISAELVTEQR